MLAIFRPLSRAQLAPTEEKIFAKLTAMGLGHFLIAFSKSKTTNSVRKYLDWR